MVSGTAPSRDTANGRPPKGLLYLKSLPDRQQPRLLVKPSDARYTLKKSKRFSNKMRLLTHESTSLNESKYTRRRRLGSDNKRDNSIIVDVRKSGGIAAR